MNLDWNQQLGVSLLWLARYFAAVIAVSAVAVFALAHTTRWGRQFWRLSGAYFSPKRSWKPLLGACAVLLLSLSAVRLTVLFSFWNKGFYNALQALDQGEFWRHLIIFAVLATVHVTRVLVSEYASKAFDIHWRTWLNEHLTSDWLDGRAYYRGQFVDHAADNPDQRIQMDITAFVEGSRLLTIGAISAIVSMVAFTAILWNLSGPLAVAGVEIPRAMVFIAYLYVLVATWLAFRIGRPLIGLNFLGERLAANFRYALMRLRENAENVAFYQGERIERGVLGARFAAVIANAWALLFRGLKFDGLNLSVSQVAVVFPFILQAPRFFSGAIKLGDLTQTGQAFGQVQDALSFFRNAYDNFAQYRATLERLDGFHLGNAAARALPTPDVVEVAEVADVVNAASAASGGPGLRLLGLSVTRPDGGALLRGLSLELPRGQTLLVQGPSGSGKTTLLRALAGLWPYAQGRIERPLGEQALFLSQRPYLPLGDLRTAIAYPGQADANDDARLRDVLKHVNLGHLADQLDSAADWSRTLSLGEQQRVAFARVLFNQPRLVLLDEATSATDEGLEHMLYTLLREQLPGATLVSVGHRSTLAAFHGRRLALDGAGGFSLF